MKYIKITESKLKTSELLQKCKDKFPVWSYISDEELDKQFPVPKEITTRWFLKSQEPDEDLGNKSAEDCEKEWIKGITLRERILFELDYYEETGNHLDVQDCTLCTGSRYRDGRVPRVDWRGGEVSVDWYFASRRNPYLRSRRSYVLESLDLNSAIEMCKKNGYQVYKLM